MLLKFLDDPLRKISGIIWFVLEVSGTDFYGIFWNLYIIPLNDKDGII